MEKNSVTMQFLEFSRDLVLKILPETYYEEGMVPEATGVQKKKKERQSKIKSYVPKKMGI